MPYKPPVCPAYTQSQCLTLSPIPESRGGTGTFNSPVLSHDHDSSSCSIFAGFDWSASGANSFSPLMTSASCLSPLSVPSSVSSPAILGRFEQLSLEQMLRCTNPDQQLQHITLSSKTVSMLEAACDARAGYLGLGVSSVAAGKTDLMSLITPTNTPARSNVNHPVQFTALTAKRKYNRRRQADYDSEEEDSDSESDEEVIEVMQSRRPVTDVPTLSAKTLQYLQDLRQGQQGSRKVAGQFDAAKTWTGHHQECDASRGATNVHDGKEANTDEVAKSADSSIQRDYDCAGGESGAEIEEAIVHANRPTHNMMPTLSTKTWRLLATMRQEQESQGSRRVAGQFDAVQARDEDVAEDVAVDSTDSDDEGVQDTDNGASFAAQLNVAPVPSWLATRIEESQRREMYEQDAADVLMDTAGLPASCSDEVVLNDYDSNEGEEVAEVEEHSEVDSDSESLFTAEEGTYADADGVGPTASEMAVLAQCKRISVQDSLVIATLKRRSRIMDLSAAFDVDTPKASKIASLKVNSSRCEDDAPAVPAKAVVPEEQDITEVAMQEDRTSDIHSIFSPTSRLPMRRSVSFAKPEVTQVKTITGSPLAPKTHKRKASATSLFTATSLSETLSNATSLKKRERRTGRAMSASAALEGDRASSSQMGHKRARRSSTLTSSLAFTSNSLTPIFSSAFLRGLNGKIGTDRHVTAEVSSDPFSYDANVTLGTLKGALSAEAKQQDLLAEFGLLEDKENAPQGQQGLASRPFTANAPKSQTMNKKRSFGRTLSLLGRSQVSV